MIRKWSSRPLLVAAAVPMLGCTASRSPTEPEVAASLTGTLGAVVTGVTKTVNAVLLRCTPLPYQVVQQQIGPAGGVLRVGPHTLEVPGGALQQTVTITAEIPSEPVNSVRFSPEGLRFAASAKLTMSYANCTQLVSLPKKIVYTNELLSILEILESLDKAPVKSVSAPIDHFSRYAVAW